MTFSHKCVHIDPDVLLRRVTAGNGSVPYGLLKQAVGRGRSVSRTVRRPVCRSLMQVADLSGLALRVSAKDNIGHIRLYCLVSAVPLVSAAYRTYNYSVAPYH